MSQLTDAWIELSQATDVYFSAAHEVESSRGAALGAPAYERYIAKHQAHFDDAKEKLDVALAKFKSL